MPRLDHFNLIAPFYERIIRAPTTDTLLALAGLPIPGRLLDAGGGTGRIARTLRGAAGQIILADPSLGMLRQSAARPGLGPICAIGERLPFPDSSFSRVIMVDALHHVFDQRATAAELWRVVEPGGRIVIEEPDVRRAAARLIALGEKIALMRSHFLAPPEIAALFAVPQAQARIVEGGALAWVVIQKAAA